MIVGDASGVGSVTLWEEHIGQSEEGKSYILKGFLVREYACKKYYPWPRMTVM